MRGLWVLIALVLVAALAWWLLDGHAPSAHEDFAADDAEPEKQGPVLTGRPSPMLVESTAPALEGPQVIQGSVEDRDGKLLAGIDVALDRWVERSFLDAAPGRWLKTEASGQPDPFEQVATTRTDEDGAFSFSGLPETGESYRVRAVVTTPWVPALRHTAYIQDNSFIRFVLGTGTALKVRVVDEKGGGVAAYVTCWRERGDVDWYACGLEGVPTGDDGRLTIHLPDGGFLFSVHAPGVGWREDMLVETPQSREVLLPIGIRGGATVAGTISDTAGKPVPGARILVQSSTGSDANLYRLGTSSANGTYRIEGLLAGPLELVGVTAPGFVTTEGRGSGRELVTGDVTRVDITMVRGGVLEGTVRGPSDRVLAGALVEADAERTPEGLVGRDRAVTDAAGRYRMSEVPPGAGHVRVSAPGLYQPESSKGWYVIEGESDRKLVDITMAQGTPVAGRVVDTTGRPVAGAAVRVQGISSGYRLRSEDRKALTDTNGSFAYPGLPPHKFWRLTARTKDALSLPRTVDTTTGTAAPARLELTLRPGAVVEGRVARGEDAVTDLLRVQARRKKGSGGKTVGLRNDGTFRISGLEPGTYDVRVVNWNMDSVSQTAPLTLEWAQVQRDVVLEMQDLGRIAGIVVDGRGDPVPRVRLRLDISTPGRGRSLDTTSNRRGLFAFTTVPRNDYAFPISINNVRLPGTHKPGDVDLRLVFERPRKVRLEGTVLLPDGTPAVAGKVMLWESTPDGGRIGRTVPIANGTFSYALEQRSPESTFGAEVREVFDVLGGMISIQPLVIEPVEPDNPIEFRLVAGLEIQGVVLDAEGRPVAGVKVSIAPQGERMQFRRKNMKSREDGSFQFGSLAAGAFELRVERVPAPWIAPPALAVRAGENDVRIELHRGGSIRGRVLDPQGKPIGAVVSWRVARGKNVVSSSGEDGRFELFPIPPGVTGSVTAAPASNAALPMVAATVGGVKAGSEGLELRLRAGAYIEGEVTGPEGETVPNAWITCSAASGQGYSAGHVRLGGTKTFRIGPVLPGRYLLGVGATGEYVAPNPVEVRAPAKGVRIVVPKGLTLKGRLTGVKRPEQFSLAFARMTPDGPSTMSGNVTASGQFFVILQADESGTLYFYDRAGGELYGLVENAQPSPTPITVRLQRGLTVEGRIEPYAAGDNGYVYIQSPSGITPHAKVANDGSFVVHAVPPGTYDIHGISARQKLVTIKGVRAGTKDHVLRRP